MCLNRDLDFQSLDLWMMLPENWDLTKNVLTFVFPPDTDQRRKSDHHTTRQTPKKKPLSLLTSTQQSIYDRLPQKKEQQRSINSKEDHCL